MQLGTKLRASSLPRDATHGTNRMRSKTQKITDWQAWRTTMLAWLRAQHFWKLGEEGRKHANARRSPWHQSAKQEKIIREYTLFTHPTFQNGKQWGNRSLLMGNPKYRGPHFTALWQSVMTGGQHYSQRNVPQSCRFLLSFVIRLLSIQIWLA